MAALMGGVRGNRGEATRLGTDKSGILIYAQTWNSRIRVELRADGGCMIFVDHPQEGGRTVLWQGNLDDYVEGEKL